MAGYDDVIYGGQTLNVVSFRVRKVPATIKQKVGRVLVRIPVVGRDALDYEFDVDGLVTGADISTLETNRQAIEALNDTEKHHFATGITAHVGSYIILPDSLNWDDSGEDAQGVYRYKFTLVQYNQ